MAKLSRGIKLLAIHLQNEQNLREAAMMHGDVRSRLQTAIQDAHSSSGYGYYVDHSGDGETGDVVYQSNGKLKKAAYQLGKGADGKQTASVSTDKAKPVTAVTSYKEGEGSDAVAQPLVLQAAKAPAVEALRKLFGTVDISTICEALKSRTQEAARAIVSVLSAETQQQRETLHNSTWKPDGVLLCESSRFLELPKLAEGATTDYPIKLISPGRGSSGFYPPETLKKAAENKVFKAGTQMFWNHDTDAEESSRPEGDLNRLAAVTTTDAAWNESGHDGPGLYARAKVFSDYADKVKEKGPHIGLSIRAGGHRDEAAVGADGKKGVITALKNAASVDFVTKAGRDGKIFTESATAQEGEDMDKTEIQALFKEALDSALAPLRAENKKLSEAIALSSLEKTVPKLVEKALADVRLPDATKRAIVEKFSTPTILGLLPMKEGSIDPVELAKMVEAEAVRQRDYLVALGYGNDIPAVGVRMTEAELKQTETERDAEMKQVTESLADILVGEKRENDPLRERARLAVMKGRAA